MYCMNCGRENPPQANYCHMCGAPLQRQKPEMNHFEQNISFEQKGYKPELSIPELKRLRKNCLLLGAVLFVLLEILWIYIAFFSKSNFLEYYSKNSGGAPGASDLVVIAFYAVPIIVFSIFCPAGWYGAGQIVMKILRWKPGISLWMPIIYWVLYFCLIIELKVMAVFVYLVWIAPFLGIYRIINWSRQIRNSKKLF